MSEVPEPAQNETTINVSEELRHRLDADYQDRLNIFRASVVELLVEAEALHGDEGWAAFYGLGDVENQNDDIDASGGFKDVLIMMSGRDGPGSNGNAPTIRILTNESYKTPNGLEWYVEDLIVDYEGDSQYLVSACNPTVDPKAEETCGIFFLAWNDQLKFSDNYQLFTALYTMEPVDSKGEPLLDKFGSPLEDETTPFGDYHCFEDKLYALHQGSRMIDAITSIVPYARKTK